MSPHLFVFCIINGLILTAGFRSRFNFISTRISFSPLSCNPDVSTSTEDVDTAVVLEVDAYLGPTSDFDDMEAGCSIGDLGIQVMVGPSLIGFGRGLFISILDEVDEVVLPAGTPICGYSKGAFRQEADGDKSVAYSFPNPYTGVIFEKKLMPLLDAIGIVEGRVNAAVEENSNKTSAFKSLNKIKNKNKFNIAESVIGHVFSYDEKLAEIVIEPELNYLERYFIPDEETESTVWGPGRLGMYANDLAYYEGVTEEIYNRNSPELNVLQIAWRMEQVNQTLVPTWPVVITLCDVVLKNREPMELGLQYSWRYWNSVQDLMSASGTGIDIDIGTEVDTDNGTDSDADIDADTVTKIDASIDTNTDP